MKMKQMIVKTILCIGTVLIVLSNVAFAGNRIEITANAMACFNKSDSFTAYMALNLGNKAVVHQFIDEKKCVPWIPNPSKGKIIVEILKEERAPFAKTEIKYLLLKVIEAYNKDYSKDNITLWVASLIEAKNQYKIIK